ncbi:MAG TPA: class I lanthipeptide [Thermoanaerobaculia bacterium]|nr:class I lanthipeptide [Thermoanaerobaculia bacterium]
MKKLMKKKLSLNRETIHNLTELTLQDVAGASLLNGSCGQTCKTQCDTDLTCRTVFTCYPCPH